MNCRKPLSWVDNSGLQDLSSLTRDHTCAPCSGHCSRGCSYTDHVIDHALITWISCTDHVADHTLFTCLTMH